jgi:hypothetical protein
MEEQLLEYDIDQDFLDIISDFGGDDQFSYPDSTGATSNSPSISSSSDDDCSTQYPHDSPSYSSNDKVSQNLGSVSYSTIYSGIGFPCDTNNVVKPSLKNKLLSNFSTKPVYEESCSKKTRREDRLVKNREAANKSRMKRKNQLTDMEITIKNLTEQNLNLQQSNAALRAENIILNDQNNFLKGLLSGKNEESTKLTTNSISSFHPTATSFAILGLICTFSFMGDCNYFSKRSNVDVTSNIHSGRVLLSYEADQSSILYPHILTNNPVYSHENSQNYIWSFIPNNYLSNFQVDLDLIFGDSFILRIISCTSLLLLLFLYFYKNNNKLNGKKLELPK